MSEKTKSSLFTQPRGGADPPVGPPLVGALLRRPLDVVRQHMLDRLHEHGFDDLDAAHLNVLQYPGPDGVRPSDLAAQLRMSKQALNYILGQLERFGYLERQPDPDDQRSKRIVLTERGRSLVPVIRAAVEEVEDAWSQELGAERFSQLRSLLVELNRLT
jgi:DNA-binding MarR family transcriptional regulator